MSMKDSDVQPKYGLRKLSVGLASVILGFMVYSGVNTTVHADVVMNNEADNMIEGVKVPESSVASTLASSNVASNETVTSNEKVVKGSSTVQNNVQFQSMQPVHSSAVGEQSGAVSMSVTPVNRSSMANSNQYTASAIQEAEPVAERDPQQVQQASFDDKSYVKMTGYTTFGPVKNPNFGSTGTITVHFNQPQAGDTYQLKIPHDMNYVVDSNINDYPKIDGCDFSIKSEEGNQQTDFGSATFVWKFNKSLSQIIEVSITVSNQNPYSAVWSPFPKKQYGSFDNLVVLTKNGVKTGQFRIHTDWKSTLSPSYTADQRGDFDSVGKAPGVYYPGTKYLFWIRPYQSAGYGSGGFSSCRFNNIVNNGGTVTVDIPDGMTVDLVASQEKSFRANEKGTIKQVGNKLIYTLPAGGGGQHWSDLPGFALVGSFNEMKNEDFIYSGKENTIFDDVLPNGSHLEATLPPMQIKVVGKDNYESQIVPLLPGLGHQTDHPVLIEDNISNSQVPATIGQVKINASMKNTNGNISDAIQVINYDDHFKLHQIQFNSNNANEVTQVKYTATMFDGSVKTGVLTAADFNKVIDLGSVAISKLEYQVDSLNTNHMVLMTALGSVSLVDSHGHAIDYLSAPAQEALMTTTTSFKDLMNVIHYATVRDYVDFSLEKTIPGNWDDAIACKSASSRQGKNVALMKTFTNNRSYGGSWTRYHFDSLTIIYVAPKSLRFNGVIKDVYGHPVISHFLVDGRDVIVFKYHDLVDLRKAAVTAATVDYSSSDYNRGIPGATDYSGANYVYFGMNPEATAADLNDNGYFIKYVPDGKLSDTFNHVNYSKIESNDVRMTLLDDIASVASLDISDLNDWVVQSQNMHLNLNHQLDSVFSYSLDHGATFTDDGYLDLNHHDNSFEASVSVINDGIPGVNSATEFISLGDNQRLTGAVQYLKRTGASDFSSSNFLYSTSVSHDLNQFVTADKVSDWNLVKTVALKLGSIPEVGYVGRIVLPLKLFNLDQTLNHKQVITAKLVTDVGTIDTQSQLLATKLTHITVRYHYRENNQDKYIDLPDVNLTSGIDTITNDSLGLFSTIAQTALPAGFRLVSTTPLLNMGLTYGQVVPVNIADGAAIYEITNQEQLTIRYVDANGAEVGPTQHLDGITGQVLNLDYDVPEHYVLMNDAPKTFVLSIDPTSNYMDVVVMPKIDFRSHVIGAADLNKTVTRTINVTQPDGTVKTILQTVKFIRDDQFNEVTGAHNYTDWISNGPSKFSAYISDVIDGYLAPVVKTMSVVPDTGNQVVDVSYVKINVVSHPVYIDAAGHGYNELPAGYHVVAGQTPSNGSMLIAKDFVPVAPKLEFVTRTVVIVMPNGRTRIIKQKVRQGTKFGKVAVPKMRGYKVVVSGNSQELGRMTANSDVNMTVSFVKI